MFVALPTKEPQYLKIKRKLGEGSFGKVYEIKYKDQPSALKIVEKAKLIDRQIVKQEIQTIQHLMKSFPDCLQNIICYYDVLEDEEQYYFISEMMDSDLFDIIVNNSQYKNLTFCKKVMIIYSMTRQILEGLDILHKIGIFHRDIKLENFLIGKDKNGKTVLKITDFGLSCVVPNCPWDKNIGSREYLHPDLLINPDEKWKFAYDLYAVGICLYTMLTSNYLMEREEINYLMQELRDQNIEQSDFLSYYEKNYKQGMETLESYYRTPVKNQCTAEELKIFDKLFYVVKKLTDPNLDRDMTVGQVKLMLSI
jgi:serine/threonine protein kinase